jgi:UDP-GlcNAc:undecaprenyl-phosphate/decaprenyl-phosphate GlcNAc-1-phosphate transferase
MVLTPLAGRLGTALGLVSNPRLFGRSETRVPNIGGIALALAAAIGFWARWGLPPGMGIMAIGGLLAVALGLADDRVKALQALTHHRLALQVAIATAAWIAGLRADARGVLGLFETVFFLVACMNAFNLLDNMDGVAGTTGATVAGGIATLALLNGQYMVASLAAAVCGACLGFLPYNFKSARIYLGNGGSLLLGFLLAGAALKLRLPLGWPWSMLAIIALVAVPATDTAVVIVSRFLNQRPIMCGGVDHISHRLVKLGFTSTEAALMHGGAALVAAGFGTFAVARGWHQLVAIPLALLGAAGIALLKVPVYKAETGAAERERVGRASGSPLAGQVSPGSAVSGVPVSVSAAPET